MAEEVRGSIAGVLGKETPPSEEEERERERQQQQTQTGETRRTLTFYLFSTLFNHYCLLASFINELQKH